MSLKSGSANIMLKMQGNTEKDYSNIETTTQSSKSLTKFSYELALRQLGGFGRYQIFAIAWYTVVVFVLGPYYGYLAFAGAMPAEVCIKATSNEIFGNATTNKIFGNTTSNQLEECEFVTQFHSIVNEWKLTGDRRYLNAMATSVQLAGSFVGPIVSGQLSDKLGRKITFSVCFVLLLVAGVGSALSISLKMFMVFRFVTGLFLAAASSVQFVWYIEFIPEKWRLYNNIFGYSLGSLYLAFLAYLTKDWRKLGLWVNLWALLIIPMTMKLDESPKWLIQRNRLSEAEKVLKRIASWNRVPWQNVDALTMIREELGFTESKGLLKRTTERAPLSQQSTKTYCYWHLFRNRKATIQAVALAFSWATVTCLYNGLVYNVSNFAGNIFLNYCVLSGLRSFFNLLTALADRYVSWFGRQFCNQLGLLSTMMCMIVIVICYVVQKDHELDGAISWAAIFGISFGIGRLWVVVEIYVAEIFPTDLRNMGYGFCSLWARVGGTIGPQIFLLFYTWKPGPFIIFGALMIANSITSCIFLPETKGTPLPDLPKAG